MTCAWYHIYIDINYDKVGMYLKNAYTITKIISKSNQERIEEYLSPVANILLECGKLESAAEVMLFVVTLCEKYRDIKVYQRLWRVLLEHLLQIYYCMEDHERCMNVIGLLEENVDKEIDIEYME